MKKLPLVIISLLVIASLVIGFFIFKDRQNQPVEKDNKPQVKKVDETKLGIEFFPTTIQAYFRSGSKNEWKSRIFQGYVKFYEIKNGIKYVVVEYQTKDSKTLTVNILLQMRKELASPVILASEKDGEDSLYGLFADNYISKITVYNGSGYTRDEDTDREYTFDEFKEQYPAGTPLAFKILVSYPEKVNRTQEYCNTDSDILTCVFGDMTDIYSGRVNIDKLWAEEQVPDTVYIVHKGIYTSIVLKDKKQ